MYMPSKKETIDTLRLIKSDYENILKTLSYNDEKRAIIYEKISAITYSIILVEKTKSKIFEENNTYVKQDEYPYTPGRIEMGML